MTFAELLTAYHRLEPRTLEPEGARYATKAGVRGFPGSAPGADLLHGADLTAETLVDASGTGGMVALAARARGDAERALVIEPSRAALRCASWTFAAHPEVNFLAGATWDAPPGEADLLCTVLPTDRGSARVAAELAGAHAALKPGGAALLVMHKDGGAKRYEKLAATLFGDLEVIAKGGGWRLSRAVKVRTEAEPVRPLEFGAAGFTLQSEPGVFAAGKLDPGTARLLEVVDWPMFAGRRVLDLGCGYGLLALRASLEGAVVTAVDDDFLAVRSAHRNAGRYGADVRALHSDVDSELQGAQFEVVLTNPPFHLGKQVALEVPQAFLAAAHERLTPGGTLTLVANRALPYERALARFAWWEVLLEDKQFKVLRATR